MWTSVKSKGTRPLFCPYNHHKTEYTRDLTEDTLVPMAVWDITVHSSKQRKMHWVPCNYKRGKHGKAKIN